MLGRRSLILCKDVGHRGMLRTSITEVMLGRRSLIEYVKTSITYIEYVRTSITYIEYVRTSITYRICKDHMP